MVSTHVQDEWARDYDELNGILEDLQAATGASELHGLVTGQHCGGSGPIDPSAWLSSFIAEIKQDLQMAVKGGGVLEVEGETDGEVEREAVEEVEEIEVSLNETDAGTLQRFYQLTAEDLSSELFEFNLLLPDDEHYGLAERVEALANWVRGFLVGIGLSGRLSPAALSASAAQGDKSAVGRGEEQMGESMANDSSNPMSPDLREALQDLAAIAQVDTSVMEENDNERYYSELVEYVKILVLTINTSLAPVAVH